MLTVIGLMSGTSMDGVDVAVLKTDGQKIEGFGPTGFRIYTETERDTLRRAVAEARELADRNARPGALAEAERLVTSAHAVAVERLLAEDSVHADLVGFHGQTVFHAPDRRLTVQIGDGQALASRLHLPVVYDFRAADVAAGGQGAPFVPVYHQALVRSARLAGDVAVVNIGGVSNISLVGADGALTAGDTGPGNALLDDFVRERTGARMDSDGALAAAGKTDREVLERMLAHPFFARPMPKSLDRNAFSLDPVRALSTEDGAATLASFTAEAIMTGIRLAGGADTIIVAGGGARNPAIMSRLRSIAGGDVLTADALGWSPDFIEAQAFGYLAARSAAGLPLSFPTTTGAPRPMTGGVTARP